MKQLRQFKRVSLHKQDDCLGDSLFAFGVKVDSADVARHLVKADVVEAFEASPRDGSHTVVGHQEVFFPAHEDVLPLGKVLVGEVWLPRQCGEGSPGVEAVPMLHVDLVIRAPIGMLRLEGVLVADDLALKVRRESRMIIRQTCAHDSVSECSLPLICRQ